MKRFLSLYLVLTLLATSAHTQTISRKVVLAKGQKLEQSATTRVTMEMKVFGKVEKVVNSGTNRVEVTVNEILDTAYQLNKRMVHATEKSESSKENYEYDSDKAADPDNPERWEKFIDRVGKDVTILINKLGTVISRSGETDEPGGGIDKMIGAGNDLAKTKTYELVANLPLTAVKVGDSWEDSAITEQGRQVNRTTLTSLTATEGVLNVVSQLSANVDKSKEDGGVRVKLEGTIYTTVRFDPATGIIKTKEEKLDAEGTFGIMGFNVPTTFKIENSQAIRRL